MLDKELDTSSQIEIHAEGENVDLGQDDLEGVAGGGDIVEVYDALKEAWTDIKKGIVDGFNGE